MGDSRFFLESLRFEKKARLLRVGISIIYVALSRFQVILLPSPSTFTSEIYTPLTVLAGLYFLEPFSPSKSRPFVGCGLACLLDDSLETPRQKIDETGMEQYPCSISKI